MINAQDFVEAARGAGYTWYAGVPCSFLTPFINYVIGDDSLLYLSAANEGDAVAAAAGARIGGKQAIAMMQNSGLGNAVSPLTSLTHVFRIPLLVICTHRGAPGVQDEPQHELMGRITGTMFDAMEIPWEDFPSRAEDVAACLARAQAHCAQAERPYALVMQKGAVAPHPLTNRPASPRAATAPARGELARPGAGREIHPRAGTLVAQGPADDLLHLALMEVDARAELGHGGGCHGSGRSRQGRWVA